MTTETKAAQTVNALAGLYERPETRTRLYQQWVCLDCGTPSHSAKSEPGAAKLRVVA